MRRGVSLPSTEFLDSENSRLLNGYGTSWSQPEGIDVIRIQTQIPTNGNGSNVLVTPPPVFWVDHFIPGSEFVDNRFGLNSLFYRILRSNRDFEVHELFVTRPGFTHFFGDWLYRFVDISYGGRYSHILQFPVLVTFDGDRLVTMADSLRLYPNMIRSLDIVPIDISRYELRVMLAPNAPNIPLYVNPNEVIGGQVSDRASHLVDPQTSRIILDGYVNMRSLASFGFSWVTPNSLPTQILHSHFAPFVDPYAIDRFRAMGIDVYIDGEGLVRFPSYNVFEAYFSAFISGEKFLREWLASRAYAKSAYSNVAKSLPEKMLAAKPSMISRYESAINSDSYDSKLSRFNDPRVLSELFGQSLDNITEIAQAKVEKLVRSVEKKRTLSDRLTGIIEYYRTSPDSSITLPTGLADSVLRSLISQPLSKLMADLNVNATDAYLAEAIASDLADRLGFQRRAGA